MIPVITKIERTARVTIWNYKYTLQCITNTLEIAKSVWFQKLPPWPLFWTRAIFLLKILMMSRQFRDNQQVLVQFGPVYCVFSNCIHSSMKCKSSGGEVVKLMACGARGPGFDSWSHRCNFRDWSYPASESWYGWNIANIVAAFRGMHASPAKHSYARLPRKCDNQESVTTGQTDAGQSDPYVPLCLAGDTKMM